MPVPPPVSVGTSGRIILVEEYDALSIAFGSALRKLAPTCHTVVVPSLAEAEIAAAASRPDLFIIDFDPPHSGAVDFFNRMKAAHPNARVLLIVASIWPELSKERIRPGAFHFVAKPFEIAKFGAAVEALIPGESPSQGGGTLRDLDLTDLIALFGVAGVTTVLRVTAISGETGEISFSAGHIAHAVVMGKAGVPALEEMLRWPSPRFVENGLRAELPGMVRGMWNTVLLEALRTTQTEAASLDEESSAPAEPEAAESKIMVIDDTELLLVFVEDTLRTARPSLQIATAASAVEGLERTIELLPDLILLDYSLPDYSGDEVCRLLLEDERTAHIPVVMMSGHIAEMMTTAERYRNVVATIGKPFHSADLVKLVGSTLANLPTIPPAPPQPKAPPAIRSKPGKTPPHQKASKPKIQHKPKPKPAKKASIPLMPAVPAVSDPGKAATMPTPEANGQRNGSRATPEPPPPPPSISPAPLSAVAKVNPLQDTATASAVPSADIPKHPPSLGAAGESAAESPKVAHEAPVSLVASTPARVAAARSGTVILTLPLEIVSIQFSPSLQTRAIRAKPYSSIVSVQINPEAGSQSRVQVAAMAFEIDHVDLNATGQVRSVRLRPSTQSVAAVEAANSMMIADLAAFPGDGTMAITPSSVRPMRIRLQALFEVVAVELTPTFAVEHLILGMRAAKVRLCLRPGDAGAGLTFANFQVRSDRVGQIAEVSLSEPE